MMFSFYFGLYNAAYCRISLNETYEIHLRANRQYVASKNNDDLIGYYKTYTDAKNAIILYRVRESEKKNACV